MALKKTLLLLSLGILGGGLPCGAEEPQDAVEESETPRSDDADAKAIFEAREEESSKVASQAQATKRSAKASDTLLPAGLVDFTPVVKKVMGSVVSITADQEQPGRKEEIDQFEHQFRGTPFEDFFKNFMGRESTPRRVHVGGSGFFIKVEKDCAYVVTNSHVVENAVHAKVIFDDKTEAPASVHGTDPRTDLAVLRVELKDVPEEKRAILKALQWGDSSQAEVGQWVLAFGNPFGLGSTVTAGIVSAKGRDINTGGSTLTDDYLQHSAPINMGNSGGCLVNTKGFVIGINTVIITPSGGNVGIGLAITSANARRTIEQLILHGEVQHGALGVNVQDFTKEGSEALDLAGYKSGAIVVQVNPDGPARKAGIKKGDIIVKFDDRPISDRTRLSRLVSEAEVNTVHTVTVIRNGKVMTIKVSLANFDQINKTDKGRKKSLSKKSSAKKQIEVLGMVLIDPDPSAETAKNEDERLDQGAFVVKVASDSAADEVGLARGDLIVEVNQKAIETAQDFYDAAVKAAKAGKRFLFLLVRNHDGDRFLSLRLDEDEELKKLIAGKAEKKTSKERTREKAKASKAKKAEASEAEEPRELPEPAKEEAAPAEPDDPQEGDVSSAQPEARHKVQKVSPEANVSSQGSAAEIPQEKEGAWASTKKWFSGLFK